MPIRTKEHPLYDIRACPYCNETVTRYNEHCLKNFTNHVLECERLPYARRYKPDEDEQACWVCGRRRMSFRSRNKFLTHIKNHKRKRPSAEGWYEKLASDVEMRDHRRAEKEVVARMAKDDQEERKIRARMDKDDRARYTTWLKKLAARAEEEEEEGTVYKTVFDGYTQEWHTCPDKSGCKWKLRTSTRDAKKKIRNHWISKHLKLCPHCGRPNPDFNADIPWGSGFAAHVLNCHKDNIIREYERSVATAREDLREDLWPEGI